MVYKRRGYKLRMRRSNHEAAKPLAFLLPPHWLKLASFLLPNRRLGAPKQLRNMARTHRVMWGTHLWAQIHPIHPLYIIKFASELAIQNYIRLHARYCVIPIDCARTTTADGEGTERPSVEYRSSELNIQVTMVGPDFPRGFKAETGEREMIGVMTFLLFGCVCTVVLLLSIFSESHSLPKAHLRDVSPGSLSLKTLLQHKMQQV